MKFVEIKGSSWQLYKNYFVFVAFSPFLRKKNVVLREMLGGGGKDVYLGKFEEWFFWSYLSTEMGTYIDSRACSISNFEVNAYASVSSFVPLNRYYQSIVISNLKLAYQFFLNLRIFVNLDISGASSPINFDDRPYVDISFLFVLSCITPRSEGRMKLRHPIKRLSQNDWELPDRPAEHPSLLDNIPCYLYLYQYTVTLPVWIIFRYIWYIDIPPGISDILIYTRWCINWLIYRYIPFDLPSLDLWHTTFV